MGILDFIEKKYFCYLFVVLLLQVKNTDYLPKQVCAACIESFNQYQNFFYQVLDAEKKLKKLWRQTQVSQRNSNQCVDCPLCLEGSMGVKDGRIILGPTAKNNKDHRKALGHVDNECLAQMIKQELQNEVIQKIDNSEVPAEEVTKFEYVCFTCGEGFITEEEISVHDCIKGQSSEAEAQDIIKSERPTRHKVSNEAQDEVPVQCEVCGKEYKSYKRLKDHIGFCHPQVSIFTEIFNTKFVNDFNEITHLNNRN